MGVTRHGYAMLIQGGDPEICGALLDGIAMGRIGTDCRVASILETTEGKAAQVDWEMIAERLREEMHEEPVDYAGKMFEADLAYGSSVYAPGVIRRIGEKLMVGYAMAVRWLEGLHRRTEAR